MLKLLQFTYTKKDNQVSDRAIIELEQPNKFVKGIDVSHLDSDDFAAFVEDMRKLKSEQYKQTMELLAQHDLKHNFRQFDPAKMSEVQSEYV